MKEDKPVILFDGYCNLCGATVKYIQRRDKNNSFKYHLLQSKTGKKILASHKISSNIDSVVFINQNMVFIKSEAILEITKFLPFPSKALRIGRYLPKNVRDKLYDFIARNRYKWFGKKDVCNFLTNNKKF